MFKCDTLSSIFRAAPCRLVETLGKKVAECYRIFGFDSPSRQLQIVNMLPLYKNINNCIINTVNSAFIALPPASWPSV